MGSLFLVSFSFGSIWFFLWFNLVWEPVWDCGALGGEGVGGAIGFVICVWQLVWQRG